jgi:hypothetical protein
MMQLETGFTRERLMCLNWVLMELEIEQPQYPVCINEFRDEV